MNKTFSDLPGWVFKLDEISANVYEVVGTDELGHKIEKTGINLEELLEECKRDIELKFKLKESP